MSRVHLLARYNGVGLSRDMALTAHTLAQLGCEVTVTAMGHRDWTNRVRSAGMRARLKWRGWREGAARGRFDVNLMIERIRPEFLDLARRNVLLPHPEWFVMSQLALLPALDRVFAKTQHALALFAARGCRTEYVGWTSADRRLPALAREPTFFHLAGRSPNKGTQPLIELWRRHPEWPTLTVIQHRRRDASVAPAPNLDWRLEYLADDTLQHLQNSHLFHLCPSQTEGYGHYLVEALGIGAVTLTVDAPPMNELVRPERGLLVAYAGTGTQRLATTYNFDPQAMAAAIERALALSDYERRDIGERARAWYEANDRAFRARFAVALSALG